MWIRTQTHYAYNMHTTDERKLKYYVLNRIHKRYFLLFVYIIR